MRIIFIRHGAPDYARDCLTETGRIQAAAAAERLAGEGIHPGDEHFDSRVREIITKAVKEVNEKLPSFRRIMKICIRKTEFVKTTTRKIKRTDENRGE